MHLRWSALASKSVVDIAALIAETSPAAASQWLDRIEAKVERLIDFPRSGTVIPGFQNSNMRQIIVGHYRIIYRIETEGVLVLTVRHAARLLPKEEVL